MTKQLEDANLLALTEELVRDEGEVLHAYQDSEGYWTIGVGILIDKRRGGGITREESRYLLANRINSKMTELDKAVSWWRTLSPVRQRVLLNMAFNLGVQGLLDFKNTLAAVKEGRYDDAALGMKKSRWASQVGARADRLIEMMKTGRSA
jgi:lysozyme